jgi:creatinine amidohydrolase
MQLHNATWQEVQRYLETSTGIIIPIGSTEQHGPTGLIGTDAITAEVIGRGAGDAAGALVAPTISVGMAVHHMDFAGTMTVRPSTLIALIQDYVLGLARHGFRRFFFVNGHGGNIPTVQAAFYEIYAAAEGVTGMRGTGDIADLRCTLNNWFQNPTVNKLSKELFGDREGSHATPSEVAVTQYVLPETIKQAPLEPPLAPAGRFFGPQDYRRRFADGRIGSDPSMATPELGKRIFDAAVADIAEAYRGFLTAE